MLLAICLLSGALGSYEDEDEFVMCPFDSCPQKIAIFPYNKTTADSCVETTKGDCDEAIAFAKKISDGISTGNNLTLDEIGEHACGMMKKWGENDKQNCFSSCDDQDQVTALFGVSTMTDQDCMDYQSDQINPPEPYDYDYDYNDQHESEVDELNAAGSLSKAASSASPTFIIGVGCIVAGVAALVAAAVLIVRGRKEAAAAETLTPTTVQL